MGIGDIIAGYRQVQGLAPNAFVNPRDAMQWHQSEGAGTGAGSGARLIPVVEESVLPAVQVQQAVSSFAPPRSAVEGLGMDPGYQDYISRSNRMKDLAGGNSVFPEMMTGNLSQSPAMRAEWYQQSVDNPQTASIMKNRVNQLRQTYIQAPEAQRPAIAEKGIAARGRLEELLNQNVDRLAAFEAKKPERPITMQDYYVPKMEQGTNYQPVITTSSRSVIAGQPLNQFWDEVTSRNLAGNGIGSNETMTPGRIYMPENPPNLPGVGYRSNLTSDINPTIDAWSANTSVADLASFQSGQGSLPSEAYDRYARSSAGPNDHLSFAPQYATQGRTQVYNPGREVNIVQEFEPVATPTTVAFNQAAPAMEVIDPAVGEAARRNFYAGKEAYESLLPSIAQQTEVGPGARMTVGEVKAADALDQMIGAGNMVRGRVPDTRNYEVLTPVQPFEDTEKLSDIVGRRNLIEQQSRLQEMGQPGFTPTEVLMTDPRVEALRNKAMGMQQFNDDVAAQRSANAGMNAANRMYEISNAKYDAVDAINQAKNQSYAAQSAFQQMAEKSAMQNAAKADLLRSRASKLLAAKGLTHLAV